MALAEPLLRSFVSAGSSDESETVWAQELAAVPALTLPRVDDVVTFVDEVTVAEISVSPNSYPIERVIAGWAVLLCRNSRSESVVIGYTTAASRGNGVVLPVVVPAGAQSLGLLEELVEERLERDAACAMDAEALLRVAAKIGADVGGSTHPIFQALVVHDARSSLQRLTRTRASSNEELRPLLRKGQAKKDVPACALCVRVGADGIRLVYRSDCATAETARVMADQLERVLGADPTEPTALLRSSELSEMAAIRDQSIGKYEFEWVHDMPIHDLFERQALSRPDHVALATDTGAWSYSELRSASLSIAMALRSAGELAEDEAVALLLPRSVEMIAGIYGALYAGGCYVPLDPTWPVNRLKAVVEDSGATRLVTTQSMAEKTGLVNATDMHVVYADALVPAAKERDCGADWTPPKRKVLPKNLVYIFFTSGTTGQPKGVTVEHRGLVHRIEWLQSTYQMDSTEFTTLKHSYTFGLSEWEIFWPLSTGAGLCVLRAGGEKDPGYLMDCIRMNECTVLVFVPSMLQMLLEYLKLENIINPFTRPIRAVFTCGEALPASLPQQMWTAFGSQVELINLYGPTEGAMTVWHAPKAKQIATVRIGEPIKGAATYVVRSDMRLTDELEPGEICFAGPWIARGYLNRPELTEKAFVPDPFSRRTEKMWRGDPSRLYRTGDLGVWRGKELDFVGRADAQVKIRGYRIELGEVEAACIKSGAAKACVIVHDQKLIAYVTGEKVGSGTLRSETAKLLPPYMVPSAVVVLEVIPTTGNGKVDRKALPPPPSTTVSEGDVVAPRNEVESAIAAVWAEVLNLDVSKISVEADFVSLGGTSLLAGRAVSKLRKELPAPTLPGTAMYTHSTVARLAAFAEPMVQPASADVKDELLPDPEKNYGAYSGSSFCVMFTQLFGVFLSVFTSEVALGLPMWFLGYAIWYYYGYNTLFLFLPFLEFVDTVFTLLLGALLKRIFGRLPTGDYPLWSGVYLRWWFCRNITHDCLHGASEIFADTPAMNWCLRLYGAKIGKGCRIKNPAMTAEPDLVIMEDGVFLDLDAKVACSEIYGGRLWLDYTRIGKGAVIETGAKITGGSVISPGARVEAVEVTHGRSRRSNPNDGSFQTAGEPGSASASTKTSTGGAASDATSATSASNENALSTRTSYRQNPHTLVWMAGVVYMLVLKSIPFIFIILMLEDWYNFLYSSFPCSYQFAGMDLAYFLFWISIPFLMRHGASFIYCVLVILQKKFIIGKFQEGQADGKGHLRYWIHERSTRGHDWEEVVGPLINTELLTIIYRALGAKMGYRVQMDAVKVTEHDLLTVEDYAVFGSSVTVSCTDEIGVRFPVKVGKGANVLDHGTLLPGVMVGELAVLGSQTLARAHRYFPPDSISMGARNGDAITLRTGASHALAPKDRADIDRAMTAVRSGRVWWMWNFKLILASILIYPLPEMTYCLAYLLIYAYFGDNEIIYYALFPAVAFVFQIIETLLVIAFKWCCVGRYKDGSFPFFSSYHYRWMVMLNLQHAIKDDWLQGSVFLNGLWRMMGANIGKNACMFGLATEYDLLTVGDYCSIGHGSDNTCHTVENMVIKLAPVKLEPYAQILDAGICMPGGVMKKGSLLLERSQVLKGETMPAQEVWEGLPAERIPTPAGFLKTGA
jgi:amino acid adenylation domain-containing protein